MAKGTKKANKKEEIHGEKEPVSIYELAGISEWNYKHKNREDYEAYINKLDMSDLQSHAIEVGIVPVDNRQTLIDRLYRQFCKEFGKFSAPKPEFKSTAFKLSAQEAKILELLKGGR